MPRIPELLGTRSLAGSETMFRGIQKLLPGHILTFERGDVQCRRYWDIPARSRRSRRAARSRAEDVERFRALFDESIVLRLMSDVPLGVFLSGGIDSSAIAALMARHLTQPLQTFSVAFADRAYSELEYARAGLTRDRRQVARDRHRRSRFLRRAAAARLARGRADRASLERAVVLRLEARAPERDGRPHRRRQRRAAGRIRQVSALAVQLARRQRVHASRPARGADTLARQHRRVPGALGRYVRRSFVGVEHAADLTFFDTFAGINLTDQRRLLSPRLALLASAERAYGSSMAYFNARGDRPGSSTGCSMRT